MKIKTIKLIALLIIPLLLMTNISLAQKDSKKTEKKIKPNSDTIQLFNGRDLTNWVFRLKDTTVSPSSVFKVQNGIIHISGSPFGYMRTKDDPGGTVSPAGVYGRHDGHHLQRH